MIHFSKKITIRWADLDPNFHLRHSVYYDLGAQQRMDVLQESGLTIQVMQQHHIGPILFREECIFKREIRFGDEVTMEVRVAKMKEDGSRWTIQHDFLSEDHKLLAQLTVDGAWMDTNRRKLAIPTPPFVIDVLNAFPKTERFSS